MYIDTLDDIVNKYSNSYHSTIKTKPVDVKSSRYTDYRKENNEKDPKFKIDDIVRISKYLIFLQKVTNWSENVFLIKKVRNTVPRTYVVNELNGEEIVLWRGIIKKYFKKSWEPEKVIREKTINHMLNGKDTIIRWIDKEDIV